MFVFKVNKPKQGNGKDKEKAKPVRFSLNNGRGSFAVLKGDEGRQEGRNRERARETEH